MLMYHKPEDLKTNYYSRLVDDPGEQLKNCIEILLENIFVNLLLHVVIVNLNCTISIKECSCVCSWTDGEGAFYLVAGRCEDAM